MYINGAKLIAMIKRDLTRTFPKANFTVRAQQYRGEQAIGISWSDGPPPHAVERVVKQYEALSDSVIVAEQTISWDMRKQIQDDAAGAMGIPEQHIEMDEIDFGEMLGIDWPAAVKRMVADFDLDKYRGVVRTGKKESAIFEELYEIR